MKSEPVKFLARERLGKKREKTGIRGVSRETEAVRKVAQKTGSITRRSKKKQPRLTRSNLQTNMIRKPSLITSLIGLMAGAFGSSSARAIRATPMPYPRPQFTPTIGGGQSIQKPRSRRRKNPFRGTTYARVIGVSSHIS